MHVLRRTCFQAARWPSGMPSRGFLAQRGPTAVVNRASRSFCSASVSASSPVSTPEERRNFWRTLFRNREDSFTLDDANDNLVTAWEAFLQERAEHLEKEGAAGGSGKVNVFVPLCGRSLDLIYLAQNEQPQVNVFGLDLAPEAFTEQSPFSEASGGIRPLHATSKVSTFSSNNYPNLRLICADIFEFPVAALKGNFHFIFDRGGLTSIPEEQRLAYLSILKDMLSPAAPYSQLVIEFLDCNLPMEGALKAEDTIKLVKDAAGFASCVKVKEEDVRASYPQFNPPGLAHLNEVVLKARAAPKA